MALSMLRLTVSAGMLAALALVHRQPQARVGAGVTAAWRAATMISRITRVQTLPRFSSWRPLRCWMLAHLECPAMVPGSPGDPLQAAAPSATALHDVSMRGRDSTGVPPTGPGPHRVSAGCGADDRSPHSPPWPYPPSPDAGPRCRATNGGLSCRAASSVHWPSWRCPCRWACWPGRRQGPHGVQVGLTWATFVTSALAGLLYLHQRQPAAGVGAQLGHGADPMPAWRRGCIADPGWRPAAAAQLERC